MFFYKTLIILLGSILIAIGINFFIVPFHLLDGGAIGIGLIIHYVFKVKVGIAIISVSIPIFFLAWMKYRTFFYNGIHGILISSVIIDFLYPLHIVGQKIITNELVGAISGGIFIGLGIGLMLRSDITIGGTDLLAQMISKLMHINPGLGIFIIDVLVVIVGSIIVDTVSFAYSCITVISVGVTTTSLAKKY